MHRKLTIGFATSACLAAALTLTACMSFASAATSPMAVCGVAHPGQAQCDASLLVKAGGRQLVRPAVPAAGDSGRRAHTVAGEGTVEPTVGSPQWLQQAYDLTALSASRGSGDTVAIVDAGGDPDAASDLARFRSTYGLPACTQANGCLRIVNEDAQAAPLPAADPSWATEQTLDMETVSSICPNCDILLVQATSAGSTDLDQAMQAAVDLGADQISDSWGITAPVAVYASDFLTPDGAALPPVFAASGDSGADGLTSAVYPAALPTVTAVGGTTLESTDSASDPRGFSESGWFDSGSGCALTEPALSYQTATGCPGRAYSDVSADANPATGLNIFEAATGGWTVAGGTSLATPMVAAFDALTDVDESDSPEWAYADAAALNAPAGGSNGSCSGLERLMCVVGLGYSGPTGVGSISGAVVAGAPGISGPTFMRNGGASDTVRLTSTAASLAQGLYTNGEPTAYFWQYGTTARYGHVTRPQVAAAAATPTSVTAALTGLKSGTTYHYRLVARNTAGESYGYDLSFTTAGSPKPAVRDVKRAKAKAAKKAKKTKQAAEKTSKPATETRA